MAGATTKGEPRQEKPVAPPSGALDDGARAGSKAPKTPVKALSAQPALQVAAGRKGSTYFGENLIEWCGGAWLWGLFGFLVACEAQMICLEMAESRHVLPSIREGLPAPVPYIMTAAIVFLVVCVGGGCVFLRRNLVILGWFFAALIPMTLVALVISYFATGIFDTALAESCDYSYDCKSYGTGGAEMSILLGVVLIFVLIGLNLLVVAGWWEAWREQEREKEQEKLKNIPMSAPKPRAPVVVDNILD